MYQLDRTFSALPLEAFRVTSNVETDGNGSGHEPVVVASDARSVGGGLAPRVEAAGEPEFPMGTHAPMWFLAASGSWRAGV